MNYNHYNNYYFLAKVILHVGLCIWYFNTNALIYTREECLKLNKSFFMIVHCKP